MRRSIESAKLVSPAKSQSFAILSHLRWVAALAVAIQHIRQALLVDYAQIAHPNLLAKVVFALAGYGQAGVVVFFVLSGFLVGGKALDLIKSPNVRNEWQRFLVDRFSRIFVVLWPALVLSALVFAGLLIFAPNAPFVRTSQWGWDLSTPLVSDTPDRWLAATALLNEFLVPTLRVNSPLWSLAYEWFYYIFALAAVLTFRRVWSLGALLVIVYGAALVLISLIHRPAIVVAGSIWLLGVGARIVFDRRILTTRLTFWFGIAVAAIMLIVYRSYLEPDFVLACGVAFMIAHTGWATWHGASRIGDRLAGFSYSLYVVHFPILLALMGVLYATGHLSQRLPFTTSGLLISLAILCIAIVAGRIFAFATEDRTRTIRNGILRIVDVPQKRTAV